jgi:hypothetical protein
VGLDSVITTFADPDAESRLLQRELLRQVRENHRAVADLRGDLDDLLDAVLER